MKRILFKGQPYLLVGTLTDGGAIATEAQFRDGEVSYAHLYATGDVQRHGARIGGRTDIEVLGDCDIEQSPEALGRVLRAIDAILPGRRWFS